MSVVNIGDRLAPPAHWRGVRDGEHFVQFYDRDESLIESVAGYMARALQARSAAFVIATPAHRELIAARLQAQGLDTAALTQSGQYTPLDAEQTLARFTSGGHPDGARFIKAIGPLFATAWNRFGNIAAFGEMVALLWQSGDRDGARELEEHWNELRRHYTFSLFCAYPMQGFDAASHAEAFGGLCAQHTTVIPAESYSAQQCSDERLLTICRLQQKATALEQEVMRRTRVEEQLGKSLAELAEATRRKDEFLAMLGHELRNPLAPIRNIAEVLCRLDSAPPEQRPLYEMLGRQVGQLTRLLDDLLDVGRITQGKIDLRCESLELMTVVSSAIESCRAMIDARRHHLAVSLPEEPVRIRGDHARLVQVLSNLLHNAAKYTAEGGDIGIRVECRGERVQIRVRDDGIGISPDILPKVFDLFAQAKRSLDRSDGGLGIGLTIVRSLVELHGGHIEAHSDGVGRGSEFVVDLPLPEAVSAESDADAIGQPRAAPAPRSILIVDDNRDSADSMAAVLRLSGHEVHTVYDGPSAVESMRRLRPDIALLDLGLPVMDGYEVARRVREFDPQVRIVAVTGYGQATDRTKTHAAGFDHHLVKPVDPETLERLIAG